MRSPSTRCWASPRPAGWSGVEGARYLATCTGVSACWSRARPCRPRRATGRVLVAAPQGPAREQLRDLVHAMGHDVSLADDRAAAELAGGRFDTFWSISTPMARSPPPAARRGASA